MKKINVAILDTGVKKDHPAFNNCSVEGFSFAKSDLLRDFNDEFGHGTAVYNIIRKSNSSTNITNIKIKNINESFDDAELIDVLNYIYYNIDVHIINISFGINICDKYDELYNICKMLCEKGTIIVSAFDNLGTISYPAAFDCVIGVTSSANAKKTNEIEYSEDDIVNIAAYGNIQRIAWVNPDYIMMSGNSFACAHVTSIIAEIMSHDIFGFENVLRTLKNKAIRQYTQNSKNEQKTIPFKIKKAVLFPFNKEMHSLIRFYHLLDFDIVGIYDTKYSGTVGASTAHLLKDENVKNIIIENINNLNVESFDTMILGHTTDLISLIDRETMKNELIETILNHGKNLYTFDDITEYTKNNENVHLGKKIYTPKVIIDDLPNYRFGKLYRISKPVVGILGTSSRQGKFTLQLKIRELLKKNDYDVGQIGTEPSSLLYGMDYVFPMGYHSTVYIKNFDVVRYLNYLINQLCIKNKEIILVGSQSQTIPYEFGNYMHYTSFQMDFLFGTHPDVVILNVNPYDEIEYIVRTINFIESLINCKVLALVVFPMNLKNDWSGIYGGKRTITEDEYNKVKISLAESINLPIYRLDCQNDIICLTDTIISHFS